MKRTPYQRGVGQRLKQVTAQRCAHLAPAEPRDLLRPHPAQSVSTAMRETIDRLATNYNDDLRAPAIVPDAGF